MREQNIHQKRVQYSRNEEIYRLRVIEGLDISSIMEKNACKSCDSLSFIIYL